MIIKTPRIIHKMGGNESKQEEIIIAQNGANSASTSDIEVSLKMYGSIMLVGIIIFGILFLYMCIKKCREMSSNWVQTQIKSVHSEVPVVAIQQPQTQAQPQVVYTSR